MKLHKKSYLTIESRDLAGKVVIVTHAATPDGQVIARALSRAGAWVVVHFSAAYETAKRLVDEIRSAGGRVLLVSADLSDPAQAWELVERTVLEWGQIDALAHILEPDGAPGQRRDRFAPPSRTPAEIAAALAEVVAARMCEREGGRISLVVREPSADIETLAEALRRKYDGGGIRVDCHVNPEDALRAITARLTGPCHSEETACPISP